MSRLSFGGGNLEAGGLRLLTLRLPPGSAQQVVGRLSFGGNLAVEHSLVDLALFSFTPRLQPGGGAGSEPAPCAGAGR